MRLSVTKPVAQCVVYSTDKVIKLHANTLSTQRGYRGIVGWRFLLGGCTHCDIRKAVPLLLNTAKDTC